MVELTLVLVRGDPSDERSGSPLPAAWAAALPPFAGVLHIVLVDTGAHDRRSLLPVLAGATPADCCRYLHRPGLDDAAAWNLGLDHCTTDWVGFLAAADAAWPPRQVSALLALLQRPSSVDRALVSLGPVPGPALQAVARLQDLPLPSDGMVLRCDLLRVGGLRFDPLLASGFEAVALVCRYLLAARDKTVVWLGGPLPGHAAGPRRCEPPATRWADPAAYGEAIERGHLALLGRATQAGGAAPVWLQRAVLRDLQWYFSVDRRERAPTMRVDEAMAAVFHALVGRVMACIDAVQIGWLATQGVDPEVLQALASYGPGGEPPRPVVDDWDADQGLVRLRYAQHGAAAVERFLVDGRAVAPAFEKTRACRFFRRDLLAERIVWLPVAGGRRLQLELDGRPVALAWRLPDGAPADATAGVLPPDGALAALRSAFAAGGRRTGPLLVLSRSGLKCALLGLLARLARLRAGVAGAWVLTDRDADADDNAEHLYRWLRRHQPQIPAWFVLGRDSPDWPRLAAEGFRLIAPGPWCRLLYLNADQVVSSHVEPAHGGFSRAVHGRLMRWRFCFLQHGVTKDDMSHWFNGQRFDLLVTCTPEEQASIADDHTPYVVTAREARRTGFPRHDALLALARELPADELRYLMVMPTWRGQLVPEGDADPMGRFRRSEYAQRWRGLLGSAELNQLADRHGLQLAFMPHPNAVPFLAGFELPPGVKVFTKADMRIQALLCRSAILVTDFSSIAFEMACLRRPVFYYQYDRDRFYGGDHNWRPGYFDYDRNGFGPVVDSEQALVDALATQMARGGEPAPVYRRRMDAAFPDGAGQACQRVFEAISGLRRPFASPSAQESRWGAETISVIVPTFNAGKTLASCLDSLVGQVHPAIEVLIVDGVSTDDTLAIARGYAARHPFIRIQSEPDAGIYDAMNKGISGSRGAWLYFLGADDALAAPDVLSQVARQGRDGVDFLYGNIHRVSKDRVEGGPFDRGRLMHSNICHQAIFYRRSLLDRVGGYNLDYTVYADWDLNNRCFAAGCRHRHIDLTISHFSGSGFSAQREDRLFLERRLPELARLYATTYWGGVFRSGRHVFLGEARELREARRFTRSSYFYLLFFYHALRQRLSRIQGRSPG